MSFGARLTHTVDIIHRVEGVSLDDYNLPIVTESVLATVKAAIQPKSDRERALISQSGAAISDHTIFMFPTDISTADAIKHDAAICPAGADLPTAYYEIVGIPNAAGISHHLEVDAQLVASPLVVT